MVRNPAFLYKTLVFGIVLLFLGLAFPPSINANIEENEFVLFTTEICGLNSDKQTVKLTQQEADEVKEILNLISERLNNTVSREESENIFKEAVLKLDEYDLLGALSVKQAQRLVTGDFRNSRVIKVLENFYSKNQMINDNKSNYLCLIAGRATYISCSGLIQTALTTFFHALSFLAFFIYSIFPKAPGWFFTLFTILMVICALSPIPYINPLAIGYSLGLGLRLDFPLCDDIPFESMGNSNAQFLPSEGFITSYGQKGNIIWLGKFWGQGDYLPSLYSPMWGSSPVGITGFTGLKIILDSSNGDTFFFGSALKVHIGDDFP
jgi:hypothetical protein